MTEQQAIDSTRRWISDFVIGHNLCPFAGRAMLDGAIHFVCTDAENEEALLVALGNEIRFLLETTTDKTASPETSVLIHPEVLRRFEDYNQFLDVADQLLEEMGCQDIFQIASFHPDYQFGGTEPKDAENYTNRSPYPMIHILREASVDHAVSVHPDIDSVPSRNIALMNQLGSNALSSMLEQNRRSADNPPSD